MKAKTLYILLFFYCFTASSQSIIGKWESVNEETKKVESVIEIYEKSGKYFGKIIEIKDPKKKDALCKLCDGALKNKPILGLVIINGLEKRKNEWTGGTVLDPKNGKKYKCTISLEDKGIMKLRGYIGFSLFGRTAYWNRVNTK
ncbi:hypothetical protein GCM10011416_18000 [Polaribacter pacificus]|uniref:DUF2147 domain-containing protein n=1 Tax=Polaribacter pacificus TaxID=1775173 RepID=A0A917I0L5_9FLAO|nr:DUF2147 domain-containing protein [Polaribacter pacificus]GGG99934.1 hypothetical protein GCM10011416_18000 [Polaribacter pacificus]